MTTPTREPIIDCDLHQTTRGPKDLYPYLPRVYQERIELFGNGLSQRVGYPNGGDPGQTRRHATTS